MMVCKLCGNKSQLQKSHIIPEFVFTDLYDDKHRMNILSTEEIKPKQYEQKGPRERLLCAACETLLSKYETYARTAFDGKETQRPLKDVIIINGVDYKKFKLFLLSVLWRAGVSTLDFFNQVNLGPHEDMLKHMILDQKPGPYDKYPITAFALVENGQVQTGLITQPSRVRLFGQVGYRFVFGGFMWVYLVSSSLAPNEVKSIALMEDNTLCFVIGDYRNCGIITDFAKRLKEIGRI